jgi:hypothetical protein
MRRPYTVDKIVTQSPLTLSLPLPLASSYSILRLDLF